MTISVTVYGGIGSYVNKMWNNCSASDFQAAISIVLGKKRTGHDLRFRVFHNMR